MLSVAICEDEPHMARELKEKTDGYFARGGIPCRLDCHTSGEQLIFSNREYDIILMDIRLPGMSGMEAARQLRHQRKTSAIIFITSSREEVFRAFDVDAVHFLLKPVEEPLLFQALEKALGRARNTDSASLAIAKGNAIRKILFADIAYCESLNHQVRFYLMDGEKPIYYYRLGAVMDLLDGRFYQCHRSYVINLAHVEALEGDTARMANGDAVLVSRRNRRDLSHRLLVFLQGELLE